MSNIDKLKPGKYAILFRNNWDGEGDNYETFAILDAEGIWRDEDGGELLEYQGDEVLSAWPMDDGSNVLALLDELEAAEKRIAELEAREKSLRTVGVISQKAFQRLEGRESRVIALWPRPEIYLPRKRPDDGVIVYARVAGADKGAAS
ncbi:ead/Ea22-like family protein [Enterobacter hormaechei]|uniref:ead/Ea22-like family protein n=1 Tax=Enterobacter hormaechei TaxID=158836 RepID=UPI001E5DBC01|nr:ead/Ea22-like family protein [Enterobacter hormaechei]MCF1276317.1 ead/Ea22-like family protein [Enterobacter hormaechei]MDR9884123.1 ead/Ea22-like family protein [Enterobacter hormaechei subsp. xiangfangensis]